MAKKGIIAVKMGNKETKWLFSDRSGNNHFYFICLNFICRKLNNVGGI